MESLKLKMKYMRVKQKPFSKNMENGCIINYDEHSIKPI